jgi:hypothetical protein
MSLTPKSLQDRISVLVALSALLIPLSLAPALLDANTSDRANPIVSQDGWVQLFDGESTAAWRGYRKDVFPTHGWQVEDGWLQVMEGGGGGDIVTLQQYDDFELEMEWKAQAGSNSGIMYLANENNGAPYFSAPEYQVFGDEDLASSSNTSSGGLYALYSPENKKLNRSLCWKCRTLGQWCVGSSSKDWFGRLEQEGGRKQVQRVEGLWDRQERAHRSPGSWK